MMNQAYAIEHLNSSFFILHSSLFTLLLFIRLFVHSDYSSSAGVVLVLE